MDPALSRYHRQMLLPGWGEAGQRLMGASSALVLGCGALGCVMAESLARAGVGRLVIADRDVVELTNLQRQGLFDEVDADEGLPKAVAAQRRLAAINRGVSVEAHVVDVTSANIERLAAGVQVICDGLDNFQTRYLANDLACKRAIPYVYGGAVAMAGLTMNILPATRGGETPWEQAGVVTPNLRDVFPEPPAPGSEPTCDTAGVLGPVIEVVAGMQAAEAMKVLTRQWSRVRRSLLRVDLATGQVQSIDVRAAGSGPLDRFDYLDGGAGAAGTVTLCGREAVQVASRGAVDLAHLAPRLPGCRVNAFLLRAEVEGLELTVFADGRCVVAGTADPAVARSVVARCVGV